jgi:hypothetical protein
MYNKFLTLGLIILFSFVLMGYAGDKPEYVGSSKCKSCHNADKYGGQYKKWQKEKHSKAYKALSSDAAKKTAEAMGVKDPLKDEKCLSCHTTAGTKKNVNKSYKVSEGVGCESCHGPGSLYKKSKVMKDRKAALAAGMIIPEEKTCKSCHKDKIEGHTVSFSNWKEEYKKIEHPVPPENDRRKKKK